MEVCFYAYMRNDKYIMDLVSPYASPEYDKKRRKELTELEALEVLKLIESENPMKALSDMAEAESEKENGQ